MYRVLMGRGKIVQKFPEQVLSEYCCIFYWHLGWDLGVLRVLLLKVRIFIIFCLLVYLIIVLYVFYKVILSALSSKLYYHYFFFCILKTIPKIILFCKQFTKKNLIYFVFHKNFLINFSRHYIKEKDSNLYKRNNYF